MPIPIGLVNGTPEAPENRGMLDISFLANHVPTKEASASMATLADKDAKDLMNIWLKAEKLDNDTFALNDEVGIVNKDLIRLKARGFLSGGTDKVKFTPRAKTVISTMALGENNNFLQKRKEKSYSEILASMDKKGKKGFRIAFDENSHLLNLKV